MDIWIEEIEGIYAISREYESESNTVPEPTTIAGVGLAFGLGCWWKRKVGKRAFK